MNIKTILENITAPENIHEKADMSRYTSFKAGGSADLLVEPQNKEELKDILKALNEYNCEYMVLGNGSNVLVRDEGYSGIIVRIGSAFNYINRDGECLVCGAGALVSVAAKVAQAGSLTGLEFASGIPGSIGGAVFMNAGAYGGEIKNILNHVLVISRDGQTEKTMTAEELDMGYRHSVLQESGDIVLEAVISLKEGDADAIREEMADLAERRNKKQPVHFPSAGSFFKRPEGHFAGKLIEDAGCKGLCVGGAEVSTLHSGFIINRGGASASDIIRLMEIVQACVYEKFDVMLEPEVRIVGGDGTGPSKELIKIRRKRMKIEAADGDSVDDYEMTYDLHTHTKYSHGKGSVEDNVRVAIDRDLEYIAISDHGPGHIFYGVNRNDFVNLRNDIEKMNVKFPKTNVRISIEANIVHSGNGLDIRPEEFDEFDFVIGGFHFGLFGCSSVRNWLWSHGFKAGEESLRESNTEMIINALRKNNLAILTHPGDKGPFDIRRIAEVCAETETLMEINSRHGHLTEDEIKTAAEIEGVQFIISSDAHSPEDVGNFKPGLQRAIDAGLDLNRIVNIRRK